MIFTHRPMQPEDIPECVKIMWTHPVFGLRYGREIETPPEAWLRLLQSEAKIVAVFRAGEGPRATIVGSGLTAIGRELAAGHRPRFRAGTKLRRRAGVQWEQA